MPRDFKKIMIARFLFTLAVQMQAVILGWRIYDILKDPLALGFIGLCEAIPAIGLALFAGYLVDRVRPLLAYRRVIYVSLCSGLLVLFEHVFADQLTTPKQVGLLYLAAFLTGVARSFSQPSIFSVIPRIVPREKLMTSTAISSSVMQTARIVGPAAGGLLFGFFGAIVSSTVVCFSLLCAIFAIITVNAHLPAPNLQNRHISKSEELFSGVKFVFNHPILFPALSLDMISVLFGGVTALLPIFASEVLNTGPQGLGILRAAPAFGATLMSVYLVRNHRRYRTGGSLFSSVAGFGICILIFGISKNYVLSLVALALAGIFDSVSMTIRSAAVQLVSPDHMRGKISAVNSIFIGSSNEIGEFESGVAARLLGLVPSVIFGAIMCLGTVGIVQSVAPALRKMDLDVLERTKINWG